MHEGVSKILIFHQIKSFKKSGALKYEIPIILWEKNLIDKKYILYAYDFGAVHLGDPETYGATVSVKF